MNENVRARQIKSLNQNLCFLQSSLFDIANLISLNNHKQIHTSPTNENRKNK